MSTLLDKHLIFVTGKGGVGKSTVSAALAMAAADRGLRTIVCEVSKQEHMSRFFHREGIGFNESRLHENVYAISIDPDRSLEEYLRLQIKVKPVADLLFSNRIFHYFAVATPGMKELVTIGKAWELAQPQRRVKKSRTYDLVIVDAPATGHGIGMLRTPKLFADIAKMGPVKRQGDIIHGFITDKKKTGVVAVTMPEEMPVTETIELEQRLKEEMGIDLDCIFMNGLYPKRFTKSEVEQIKQRFSKMGSDNPGKMVVRGALRAAISESTREQFQRKQAKRLKKSTDSRVVELPFIFTEELDVEHFQELSKPIGSIL